MRRRLIAPIALFCLLGSGAALAVNGTPTGPLDALSQRNKPAAKAKARAMSPTDVEIALKALVSEKAELESETSEIFRQKMIEASSRDAVRVRSRTGKPARQLRSPWTESWERSPESPGALPMPLMSLVSENALRSVERAAAGGNDKARDLVTYFVGQGVGLVENVRSATGVVQDFKSEFLEAVERMNALLDDE